MNISYNSFETLIHYWNEIINFCHKFQNELVWTGNERNVCILFYNLLNIFSSFYALWILFFTFNISLAFLLYRGKDYSLFQACVETKNTFKNILDMYKLLFFSCNVDPCLKFREAEPCFSINSKLFKFHILNLWTKLMHHMIFPNCFLS